MRKELRRRGVDSGVPVVYSTEEYRPLQGSGAGQPRVSGGDWQRVPLGSISTLPSMFGIMLAGRVIQQILEGTDDGK